MIFDEEVQASLFGVFTLMFSGKSAKDGVNPMREKLGESIADTRLNITDQPLNVDGFGYQLFVRYSLRRRFTINNGYF